MALVLNEEQRILKDSAREFLQEHAPVTALRKLRDEEDALGYDQGLWQQMVELGWAGISIPEAFGGLEFGYVGLGSILEESGHTLAASPLFSTVVLGASVIELCASDSQKQQLLAQIAEGKLTLALALEEGSRHAPGHISTTATKSADGYVLNGSKVFVLDGHSADQLLLVARSSGEADDPEGISVFLLPRETPGLTVTRTIMLDSRNAARVDLVDVRLDNDALLGTEGQAARGLETALDRGRIALAAEMLGGCLEMFNRTIEYLKEREQFGVKIGSFQALKHRAAIMFTEIELCKSVVLEGLGAIDCDAEDLARLASLCKARLNDTYQLITNEATQLHGGIGVTDELDVGLFLKRARVCMQILGDASFHRDRYASLNGY